MKLFAIVCLCAGLMGVARAQWVQPNDAAADPSVEYLPPSAEAAETKLADEHRQRRDVPQEYLPPIEEPSQEYLPPTAETKLADDGYRYQTVRRLKYRRQRRAAAADI